MDDQDFLTLLYQLPTDPPKPGKLQPPPAPTPDAFEQLRESFEYEAARLKSGKAATVAPSGWDAELPATAPTISAIPVTDAPLAKRAPTTRTEVKPNGWTFVYKADGQLERAFAPGVDPSAFDMPSGGVR
jgi:hypothetical protein